MGSWKDCRTERDGELNCLFIITLLLVAWMKGEGRWLIFLYHIGLWLLIGQSWEMSQSNSNKIFAFNLNLCLGARAFSPPASINEGRRETLREEVVRNQAPLTRARGIELMLEVFYSPFSQPQPKPDGLASVWPSRWPMHGEVEEVGKYFLWVFWLRNKPPRREEAKSSEDIWLNLQKGAQAFGLETGIHHRFPICFHFSASLCTWAGLQCLLEEPTHQSWI